MDKINYGEFEAEVLSFNTIIIGSGAAGFNAADSLYNEGQKDIAIVTEGINMGVSRNTGSDKQTYYKLAQSGGVSDSVMEMAKDLFGGGSMNGDTALVEAALSSRCFFKLVSIGVPFPHNKYGEYIGYQTDHSSKKRATSAGPLTSRFMTEKLEDQVRQKNIRIFDGYRVIGILTDSGSSVGVVCLNKNKLCESNFGLTVFNSTNVIYAVGGPAGMYYDSVYPESQTGASGIAFEAGVRGVNLTESQYGLASVKFRWNLSGTYQQVIPRYISTDMTMGDEKEFLRDYFEDEGKVSLRGGNMFDAIFKKGYQWPFDPNKIQDCGSSLIDILVYNETKNKNRRVFLDYTRNPAGFDFGMLSEEAYEYLRKSNALIFSPQGCGIPYERLQIMNPPSIELYKSNGIDLSREYLEIAVCAQHNNGGLEANIWYESNIKHFFPVGEVNGAFGVYRPGGAALNSTQAGGLRAAQYIAARYTQPPHNINEFKDITSDSVNKYYLVIKSLLDGSDTASELDKFKTQIQKNMSKYGGHIRSLDGIEKAIAFNRKHIADFPNYFKIASPVFLAEAFKIREILLAQLVYLCAIKEYIQKGGVSRGSYIIYDANGVLPATGLPDSLRYKKAKAFEEGIDFSGKICSTELDDSLECVSVWNDVRGIPTEESWFENDWSDYRSGKIFDGE